jgi:hypothetical protein
VLSRVLPRQSSLFRVANPLIMLSVTVLAGAVCYYLLEKPFMQVRKNTKEENL